MDKVYIDNNKKAVAIELPKYGEVTLLVKDGKVVKYNVSSSYLLAEKE